jgi:nucleoid DNA-binding protein
MKKKLVNKKFLARKLARKTLLSLSESTEFIEYLFQEILHQLLEGSDVSIVNFGKFYTYRRKERPVRNPATMEEYTLKPLNEVKFKASEFVKKTISETDISSEESLAHNYFNHDYIDHNDDSYEEENINKEIE